MASQEITRTEALIDSAIGPFRVETTEVLGFDIDDFVKTTIVSQAVYLQMREAIRQVDPKYTINRTPVIAGDLAVGGYSGN